jgi:hypothetical protein
MFSEPISITVNSIAQSLPRVNSGNLSATYQKADETFVLEISHQTTAKGRVRTLVKFVEKAVVTNPLDSSNDYDTATIQFVIDRPLYGFSEARIDQLVQGLKAWLTTANVGKLYGKES